jgi:hypothetical protein
VFSYLIIAISVGTGGNGDRLSLAESHTAGLLDVDEMMDVLAGSGSLLSLIDCVCCSPMLIGFTLSAQVQLRVVGW